MKITRFVYLLCFVVLHYCGSAQDLDLKWSEKQLYDNKKEGYFREFIEANSKYVYMKFSNLSYSPSYKNVDKKLRLACYDKQTMKKVHEVFIRGFKETKGMDDEYKGLTYYKCVVFEERVYLFWKKESRDLEELFVQSFSSTLMPEKKLKKIYERKQKSSKEKYLNGIIVLSNKKAGEKMVVGSENTTEADEQMSFQYRVMNNDLSFSDANMVTLPVKLIRKSYGYTSVYHYGDDGNIYVRSLISMTKEEKKNLKKNESSSYSILSVINVTNETVTPFTMRFENKNIFNFDFTFDPNGIKIYAFFCDLLKDPKGTDTHGIYYGVLDGKSYALRSQTFAYFEKEVLDKLFANDIEDKKRAGGLFKTKASKKSDEESIDSRYEIESVQSLDPNNIVLFCSIMNNYVVRSCTPNGTNGGMTCTNRYYCQKRNVTAFKISSEGKIIWASNLDRDMTYDGWSIKDLKVINDGKRYYAIYGSLFQIEEKRKGWSSRKRRDQLRDRFEYATFEDNTGAFKKHEFVVNAVNEKDKKWVEPPRIAVLDNRFYVNSESISMKTGYCIPSILCPPLFFIFSMNGNTQKGQGNLGVIKTISGK